MSNSSQAGSQQAAPLMDSYQPTVRVMRLYKPGFHLVQSLPHIPESFSSNQLNVKNASSADFTLSSFLLLPDSFGDIYAGEKFSAYIAVVNGFAQVPFYQVNLAVRLQTATTVIDLADTRLHTDIPGSNQYNTKTLNCNETFDMIVSQILNELGIHTLRVSVQYMLTPTSEIKTLRKFYRFNVLQPLVIQSSYINVNGKPMIQCEVTNATKSPIYIDELTFIPTNHTSKCQPITAFKSPNNTTTSTTTKLVLDDNELIEDLKLLQTGDSCAFSFLFTEYSDLSNKPPGYPSVKWCTSMGEYSIYRGEFTYMKLNSSNSSSNNDGITTGATATDGSNLSNTTDILKTLHYECLIQPHELYVGDEAEIVIRIYNTTTKTMSILLDCKNSASSQSSTMNTIASSKSGSSAIRPRLSTTSNISYANILATSSTTAISISNNSGKNSTTTGNEDASNGKNSISAAVHFSHRGLCFSGLTFTPLGIIEGGDFIDVTVSVYATSAGLHDLPTLYVVDSVTSERHPIISACRILVHDSVEEGMEEEGQEAMIVAGSSEKKLDISSESKADSITAPGQEAHCTGQPSLPSPVTAVAVTDLPLSTQPTTPNATDTSLPVTSFTDATTGEVEVSLPIPSPPPTTAAATTDMNVSSTPPPLPPSSSSHPPPALTIDEVNSREVATTSPGLLESIPPSPMAGGTVTDTSSPGRNVSADLAKFLEDSAREMDDLMGEPQERDTSSPLSTVLDPSNTTIDTTNTTTGISTVGIDLDNITEGVDNEENSTDNKILE